MYFLVAFGISFVTYLFTLAPTIYNLDSAELTTAAATLGFTRSTGYPLYIIVGNLWSKLPIGDVGYRLNLFSAFNGALTVGLLALILKQLNVKGWAAFGALGVFATGKFFWGLSSIAEVYTLQTALMAGLILCLLRWQEKPSTANMALVGFVSGLCLCHHAASVLMLPAVFLLIFTSSSKIHGFIDGLTSISIFTPAISSIAGFQLCRYL
jgi:dolichyl-phosphate-mannose--protein O-mannosyl transferase